LKIFRLKAVKKKQNKHKNKTCYYDGFFFQSGKEKNRYIELSYQQRVGIITELVLQPVFILQEKFEKNGIKFRAIKTKLDFSYLKDGKRVIEDVKGFDKKKQEFLCTKDFLIKQKLFEKKYLELTIIIV
jgi:hypothetical protein